MITYTFNDAHLKTDTYKRKTCRIWYWDIEFEPNCPMIEIRYQYLPESSDGGCQLLYFTKERKYVEIKEYESGVHPKYIEKDLKEAFNRIGLDYKHK